MKTAHMFNGFFWTGLILASLLVMGPPNARAEAIKTMALLPFTAHAVEDLSHIQKGIAYMLYSRLSWPDHVQVIPTREMETLLAKEPHMTGNQLIREVASQTACDYVLAGSITRLAGSFSIDTQLYDIQKKQYMTFFEQSKVSDDLIDKVDRIAATINQKVFNRSTVTYEKMEQEKQAYITDLKRRNPEHLMNVPAGWQEEKSPGWKIWKYLF